MGNNDSKKRKVLSDEELEQVSGGSLQSIALGRDDCYRDIYKIKEECEKRYNCEWVDGSCVRKGARPRTSQSTY